MIFLHDNDYDGMAAAAAWRLMYPKSEFKQIFYGDNSYLEEIKDHDVVVYADQSFDLEALESLCTHAQKILVFDHHPSGVKAVEKACQTYIRDFDEKCRYKNDGDVHWLHYMFGEAKGGVDIVVFIGSYDVSACEKVCLYTHHFMDILGPIREMPGNFFELVTDYDCWHRKSPDCDAAHMAFHYTPEDKRMDVLENLFRATDLIPMDINNIPRTSVVGKFIHARRPIMNIKAKDFQAWMKRGKVIKSQKYGSNFTYWFGACPDRLATSLFAELVYTTHKVDFVVLQSGIYPDGDSVKISLSLRSNSHPVRQFAEHYNGGGQEMSAGCAVTPEQLARIMLGTEF